MIINFRSSDAGISPKPATYVFSLNIYTSWIDMIQPLKFELWINLSGNLILYVLNAILHEYNSHAFRKDKKVHSTLNNQFNHITDQIRAVKLIDIIYISAAILLKLLLKSQTRDSVVQFGIGIGKTFPKMASRFFVFICVATLQCRHEFHSFF